MSDQLNWRQALLCNLGFACYCAGFVALVWLALEPVMEKEDLAATHAATPAGVILRHGFWAEPSRSWVGKSLASPTVCADICSWEPLPNFAPGYFDMIWASPVCAEYSRVLTRRPRQLEEGDRLVLRTLHLIQELQPRFWAIENPATGLLKLRPFMAGLPWQDVSYCTNGYPYHKLTRFWGNLDWMPRQPCVGRSPPRSTLGS